MSYFFRVHGLVFESELDFPELSAARDPNLKPDFRVRVAKLDVGVEPASVYARQFSTTQDGFVMSVPSAGRFHVDRQANVTIEIACDADMALLHLFFFGSTMGLVCHQLGRLPLHASAIAYNGRAFAFSGDAGAGKSTLAAACIQAGSRLVADDILVVSKGAVGPVIANPGMPKIKLWSEAIRVLGLKTDGLVRDWARADKFHIPANSTIVSDPVELSGLFILHDDDDASFGKMIVLRGADALSALIKNTYRPEYLGLTGRREAHFSECVRLSRALPVIRLSRRRDASELNETAALLMDSYPAPL